jgi:hypothetical protein
MFFRTSIHVTLCVVVAAILTPMRPATAQIQGRVLDPANTPLPGALVEIWSPTTRLAGAVTNERGQFLFSQGLALTAVIITVRRIGYQPARVPLPAAGVMTVTMAPFAQTLASVGVNAAPLCPNSDDKAGRAVWEVMRQRFRPFRPDLGVWSTMRIVAGRVPPQGLGAIDTAQATDGELVAGGAYFDEHTRRVATRGYGIPYQGLHQDRFDLWEYPRLESFFAGHFVDTVFGHLHRFSLESRSPLVLVFCPRSSKHPSIQGRLELDADTSLGRATWVFRTPEPREDAGGEVIFSRPARGAARAILLPAVALVWRKLVYDYYQEWTQFEAWHTCADNPDPRFCR